MNFTRNSVKTSKHRITKESCSKFIDLDECQELDFYDSIASENRSKKLHRKVKKKAFKRFNYIDMPDSEADLPSDNKKSQTITRLNDRKIKFDNSLGNNLNTSSSDDINRPTAKDFSKESIFEKNDVFINKTTKSTSQTNPVILTKIPFKCFESHLVNINHPNNADDQNSSASKSSLVDQTILKNIVTTASSISKTNSSNCSSLDNDIKGRFLTRQTSQQPYNLSSLYKSSNIQNKSEKLKEERKEFCQQISFLVEHGKGRESRIQNCGRQLSCEEMVWRSYWADVLWLELQACINGVPSSKQDVMLDFQRKAVPGVLNKIMDFKISKSQQINFVSACSCESHNIISCDPSPLFLVSAEPSLINHALQSPMHPLAMSYPNSTFISSPPHSPKFTNSLSSFSSNQFLPSNCKNIIGTCLGKEINIFIEAATQVSHVVDQIEWVQSLYPNDKSLQKDRPQYTETDLQTRLTCIHLWYDTTLDLVQYIRYVYELVTSAHVKEADKPNDFSLWWCVELGQLSKLLSILKNRSSERFLQSISRQSSKLSSDNYFINRNSGVLNDNFNNNLDILDFFNVSNRGSLVIDEDFEENESEYSRESTVYLPSENLSQKEILNKSNAENKNLKSFGKLTSTSSKTSLLSSDSFEVLSTSSTSFYRKFVDRSLKTSEVRDLCRRLRNLLDRTLTRSRLVLDMLDGGNVDEDAKVIKENNQSTKFEVLVESPSNSEDSCKKVAIFKNMKELNIKAEAEDIESLNKKIEECEMDEVLIRRSQGMNVSENDQAMHGDLKACMASMGLPSFKSFYLFLSKVLLDIMHEGLKMRLDQQPRINSSIESLKPLIKQCKEILRASVSTKIFYTHLIKDLKCGELHEREMEKFEDSLMKMLKIYFDYMNQFTSYLQEVSCMSRQLKDFMGREWKFCKEICRHIHNGEADAGNKFCSMTSSLLKYISDILSSGIDDCSNKLMRYEEGAIEDEEEDVDVDVDEEDDIVDIDGEEVDDDDYDDDNSSRTKHRSKTSLFRHRLLQLGRELKGHFNEAKDSSLRTVLFAKMIKNDLEVMSQYEVVVPVQNLLQDLKITNHVEIITGQKLSYVIFAPEKVANDYNLACHLLNVACCSDEHFDDDHGDYNLSYNFDIYGDPLSSVGDDFLKDSTKGSDNRVPHIPYKHSLDVTCTKDKNILDLNKNKKDQAKNVNYKYTNKKNKKQKSDKNNSQIHDSKKDETQGKVRFLSHDSDSELKDDRNKKFEKIAFQSLNISSETFMRMRKCNQYNNYLVFMNKNDLRSPTGEPLQWDGAQVKIDPNAEATIALAHVEVEKLILVAVHSSKLHLCRRTLEDCVRGDVKLVDEQVSCHQSIVESLNELKSSIMDLQASLAVGLNNITKTFGCVDFENIPMAVHSSENLSKTNKDLINYCYTFGFEYHKEVYRLISGQRKAEMSKRMIQFASQWMTFAESYSKGRGFKLRWAYQGFDFLRYLMDFNNTDIIMRLSAEEFQVWKQKVLKCSSYVVGPKMGNMAHERKMSLVNINQSAQLTSPTRSSTPTRSISSSPSLAPTTPFKPRRQEWRKAIDRLDARLDKNRLAAKQIGQVTNRSSNSFSRDLKVRKVKFKWQRGNEIGKGQFGNVFSVVNLDSGELLAMKQMKLFLNDYKRMKKIEGEIRILESVSHPSLMRFYGAEVFSDELLLFTEFCNNGTIEDLSKQKLNEASIRRYSFSILQGIYALHSHNIVHRDIKGANIFVMPNHSIKLGDFGCSVQLTAQETMPGELSESVGTPAFMAPEVINRNPEIGYGRAADIWSYGCVIIQMLTGKRPWPNLREKNQIIYKVGVGGVPEVPDTASKEAKEFVGHCLQSDPRKRWTAEQLLEHSFVKVGVDEENET